MSTPNIDLTNAMRRRCLRANFFIGFIALAAGMFLEGETQFVQTAMLRGDGSTAPGDTEEVVFPEGYHCIEKGDFTEMDLETANQYANNFAFWADSAGTKKTRAYNLNRQAASSLVRQILEAPSSGQEGFRLVMGYPTRELPTTDLDGNKVTVMIYPLDDTGKLISGGYTTVRTFNALAGFELPCPRYCD